jgi:hypothetical protein
LFLPHACLGTFGFVFPAFMSASMPASSPDGFLALIPATWPIDVPSARLQRTLRQFAQDGDFQQSIRSALTALARLPTEDMLNNLTQVLIHGFSVTNLAAHEWVSANSARLIDIVCPSKRPRINPPAVSAPAPAMSAASSMPVTVSWHRPRQH